MYALLMFSKCLKMIKIETCRSYDKLCVRNIIFHVVGPCDHGMARPQVADRGTASDKEGSCE